MSLLLLFGGAPSPSVLPEFLRTFAPNRHPTTGFFDAEILETVKWNAQALTLGATGANLIADLPVTEGHKHESATTRLAWKQIVSLPLVHNGGFGIGTSPDEWIDAVLIDSASNINLATQRLWLTPAEAADIIPRVKVSNDNSATTNCTITFYFFDIGDLTTPILSTTIVISTATARNRVWVDGTTQDLVAAGLVPDATVTTRYPCICLVSGILAADIEDVALHEIAFGVTP